MTGMEWQASDERKKLSSLGHDPRVSLSLLRPPKSSEIFGPSLGLL